MLWALLALLGVPVWLVVGMLVGALYSRRRYRQQPDVFRCAGRVRSGSVDPFSRDWGRAPVYGRWVHDVLVLNRGLALVRVIAVPVDAVVGGPGAVDGSLPRGLGDDPVAVAVRTDDGSVLELAAHAADRQRLGGPFATKAT